MRKHFGWLIGVIAIASIALISWKDEKTINAAGDYAKQTALTHDTLSSAPTVGSSSVSPLHDLFSQYVTDIYQSAQLQDYGLGFSVFERAVTGFINLKLSNRISQHSNILTVIDMSKSSREKRMWIINLVSKQMLLNTWVAHGRSSGDDIPDYFSNENNSDASSLGFYLTGSVYQGKHGRSLKLDGLDEGFNSNARSRGVVIHAADYVCQNSIDKLGRLGHSEGCPAVSPKVIKKVINTLQGGTAIFIAGNDATYNSRFLDENAAAAFLFPQNGQSDGSMLTAAK